VRALCRRCSYCAVVVIRPEPLGSGFLSLFDAFNDVLVSPFVSVQIAPGVALVSESELLTKPAPLDTLGHASRMTALLPSRVRLAVECDDENGLIEVIGAWGHVRTEVARQSCTSRKNRVHSNLLLFPPEGAAQWPRVLIDVPSSRFCRRFLLTALAEI